MIQLAPHSLHLRAILAVLRSAGALAMRATRLKPSLSYPDYSKNTPTADYSNRVDHRLKSIKSNDEARWRINMPEVVCRPDIAALELFRRKWQTTGRSSVLMASWSNECSL